MAARLPIVEDSGTVTGIVCHVRAQRKGGPRFDAKQSDAERHAFENLVLMCGRHSKLIDSEPRLYTVQRIESFKAAKMIVGENELSITDGKKVDALLTAYRDLYITARQLTIERIQADKIIFTRAKSPSVLAPDTAIGSDLLKRNYVGHLIDRYNDYAHRQPNRKGKFSFAAIHSRVRKEFGVKKWELVPLDRCAHLIALLQSRIDLTWLGRINKANGEKNYSTLEEYRVKYFESQPSK